MGYTENKWGSFGNKKFYYGLTIALELLSDLVVLKNDNAHRGAHVVTKY